MLLLLSIVLVVVLAILLLLLLLFLRVMRGTPAGPGDCPPPSIPDQLTAAQVAGHLAVRLTGTPADGSAAPAAAPAQVVWVDSGDEVLVHLDSTTAQIAGQSLLVSIDLECDQTGRTPLIVAFALPSGAAAGLVVATDEYPRGNGLLAARWGPAVQAAAWAALLALAGDHAAERQLAPRGLAVAGGQLHLIAGQPLQAAPLQAAPLQAAQSSQAG